MTVGEKIKRERERMGMSQKFLGELCGIADSAIRKYESKKVEPKLSTIVKISDALKVSPMEILPDWFIERVNEYATP